MKFGPSYQKQVIFEKNKITSFSSLLVYFGIPLTRSSKTWKIEKKNRHNKNVKAAKVYALNLR